MIAYALIALLAVLQLADVWTTRRILLAGGEELNPVMRYLIDRAGLMPALLGTKAVLLFVCWLALLEFPAMLGALCLFYAGIIWFNQRSLR